MLVRRLESIDQFSDLFWTIYDKKYTKSIALVFMIELLIKTQLINDIGDEQILSENISTYQIYGWSK